MWYLNPLLVAGFLLALLLLVRRLLKRPMRLMAWRMMLKKYELTSLYFIQGDRILESKDPLRINDIDTNSEYRWWVATFWIEDIADGRRPQTLLFTDGPQIWQGIYNIEGRAAIKDMKGNIVYGGDYGSDYRSRLKYFLRVASQCSSYEEYVARFKN